MLDLVETTRHFGLLQMTAQIGGAGSASLDALVIEIHEQYSSAMKQFFGRVHNVLQIDEQQHFETEFFHLRTVVKVL